MREPAWAGPAPCFADLEWPTCVCVVCRSPLSEWELELAEPDPATVEDAVVLVLAALKLHLDDLDVLRQVLFRNDREAEACADLIARSRRRADAAATWFLSQLGLQDVEVAALSEIRSSMLGSVPLGSGAASRTFVPEAWRALRLAAGDA